MFDRHICVQLQGIVLATLTSPESRTAALLYLTFCFTSCDVVSGAINSAPSQQKSPRYRKSKSCRVVRSG